VHFSQQIRPILSNHCFACHGPDNAEREADLRLDRPGDIDFEELVARISSTDPDLVMPPPESQKRLDPRQIDLLRRWVEAGAPYEEHWAFVPPRSAAPPQVKNANWSRQPIDRFVLARLEQEGLAPNPEADQRTLIRRVTLDLTGLPPTLAEIDAFLQEASRADSTDHAYERLVDRLLARPQYGEHMTRYWLDLVRFADTNGLHHDHYREMTPYRDWVIRSFNDNYPFDQFIFDQVAGDLVNEPTVDQQIASGFNRLHLIIDRGTALPEESFTRNVVDRVSAFGTAFLGLTLQCAVCHDHKYDPISQREFYQLYAFFNNFDGEPETGFRSGLDFERGLQPPYLNLPSQEQEQQLAFLDNKIEDLAARIAVLEQNAGEEATEEKESPTDAPASELPALQSELKQVQAERAALIKSIPAALVMKERKEVRPTFLLIRGVYDQPGEPVERNTPAFLPPLRNQAGVKTRLDLAHWVTDRSHPLTARVAVNRFWQQFFGVGLVKTSEDFGAQGEAPSHPELLDYLAVQFIDSGWDLKSLVRSIVLSRTYRQSSHAPRDRYLNDPKNRLLARGSRFRLDAEVVRDQILAITGLLNPQLFGRSVKPPQPPGLWKTVAMPSSYPYQYHADQGDQVFRRSVYTFWKRGLPPPQLTILDAPTRESCIARRERTNTPLQALLLMNEPQFFRAAMRFAHDLLQEASPPPDRPNLDRPNDDAAADDDTAADEQRVRQAHERVTSHVPDQATTSHLLVALRRFRELYANDQAAAAAMMAASDDPILQGVVNPDQQVELAAWTLTVHSLLNLDAVKTRE
jgi:hypothetical protein